MGFPVYTRATQAHPQDEPPPTGAGRQAELGGSTAFLLDLLRRWRLCLKGRNIGDIAKPTHRLVTENLHLWF